MYSITYIKSMPWHIEEIVTVQCERYESEDGSTQDQQTDVEVGKS